LAFWADGVLLFGFSGGHERGVLGLGMRWTSLFVQHGWMVVNAGRALGRQGPGSGELGLEFQGVKPRVLAGLGDAEIGEFSHENALGRGVGRWWVLPWGARAGSVTTAPLRAPLAYRFGGRSSEREVVRIFSTSLLRSLGSSQ
jgi:hypothetical protein